jgi:hypothetical protein
VTGARGRTSTPSPIDPAPRPHIERGLADTPKAAEIATKVGGLLWTGDDPDDAGEAGDLAPPASGYN